MRRRTKSYLKNHTFPQIPIASRSYGRGYTTPSLFLRWAVAAIAVLRFNPPRLHTGSPLVARIVKIGDTDDGSSL
ncbi:hypothetical protein N7535_000494 [Penicillium sp. DV-2018c]|nr:hypothetical protein N7535_000494 [Penicillium sp. DV-2018c]